MIASYAKKWGLTEGFVAFNSENRTNFSSVIVPGYDNLRTIVKLYDDIYYDNKNGNSVIVSGTQIPDGSTTIPSETSGATITAIDIYPREGGSSARYTTPATTTGTVVTPLQQIVDESKKDVVTSMIKNWTVYTSSKNQLNYMAWGTNTFLSVFDLLNAEVAEMPAVPAKPAKPEIPATATTPKIPATPEVPATSGSGPSYRISLTNSYSDNATGTTNTYNSFYMPIVLKTAYSYVDGSDVDKEYTEDVYDTSSNVYKFSNTVSYDVKNGNLLINRAAKGKSIDVYYRNNSGIDKPPGVANLTTKTAVGQTEASKQTFSSVPSQPWFVPDMVSKQMIMYWPSGSNTIIASFANYFEPGKGIPLVKVRYFTSKGVYTETAPSSVPVVSPSPPKDGSGNDIDDSLLDAFSRWYIYFNTNAIGSGNSSDYLLKTQIVPPVCPACPACPGGGSCNNCGGQGGSGTLSSTGSSLADIKGSSLPSIGQSSGSLISGTSSAIGATAVGAGNILNTTVDAAGNVVGKTVDTAGNLVGKTVDAAGNLVNKTVDTAGNIVNRTVDTAGNIVESTVGTAGNLIQSAGSGVGNLLGLNNPNRFGYDQSYRGPNAGNVGSYGYVPQQTYMATSGTYNQGSAPGANVDIYSQYGALPAKGSSNYRPLTTDFSSFRR